MKFTSLALLAAVIAQDSNAPSHEGAVCNSIANDIIYNCGSRSDLFQFTNLTITPPVLKRGERVAIQVHGRLRETLSHGTKIHYKLYLGPIRVYRGESDGCEMLVRTKNTMQCPVVAGDINLGYAFTISRLPFGGYLRVEVYGVSQTEKEIFRIKGNIHIV